MVMVWLPAFRWNGQRPFCLRLYSPPEEQVRLTFQPLKPSRDPNHDPAWEEWHCYLVPLSIGIRDYELLLKDPFAGMYPTRDPIDGTSEPAFDPRSSNWLGAEDWRKAIGAIRAGMEKAPRKRRKFYDTFLRWLEAALEHTDIIVVEGNQ